MRTPVSGYGNQINTGSGSESGVSLIAVLWIVAILTVLASEFMYSMQLEIRISRNWSDQVNAFYAAKAGLERAIILLKTDVETATQTSYDALSEDWAQEITGELNNSTYETVVADEGAKINVNTADEQTLTRAIVYCMGTSDEKTEEEISAEAQTLAAAIIESRPYRTVAEMAKVTNMTPELLYGESALPADSVEETGNVNAVSETGNVENQQEQQTTPLTSITTVYSAEKNTTSDGGSRANINSGDAQQIQQSINPEGQQVITQQEAQAIVDYGSQVGNNQQGGNQQGGNQQSQGGSQQPQVSSDQGVDQTGEGGQTSQGGYTGISQLLDVPAISQQTFDSISSRISVDSGQDNNNMININTADENTLQTLSGIDSGIAASIVRYRNQNQFDNVDEIREVKAISIDDMKAIADRVAISGDAILEGKVNINTAPLLILQMLPGMDEEKAQAIIDYRTVEAGTTLTTMPAQQGGQQAGPFTSIGQLLDVQGIDENTFRGLVDYISCRSAVFEIRSEGRSLDDKIIQNCVAVVDRSGNRIKTRYWEQE